MLFYSKPLCYSQISLIKLLVLPTVSYKKIISQYQRIQNRIHKYPVKILVGKIILFILQSYFVTFVSSSLQTQDETKNQTINKS